MKRRVLLQTGTYVVRWFAAVAAGVLCWDHPARAAGEFEPVTYENARYTIKWVDLSKTKLRLFLADATGKAYKRFAALDAALRTQNLRLRWAMNAGMYHGNFAAVGLCVIDGKQLFPLNLADDEGNFFLKPNGVFLIQDGTARIMESQAYSRADLHPELATQSGPMLLIDGKIHHRFAANSTSRLLRNGVGVTKNNKVAFVITETPVNLHEFARFFRDRLQCENALFLDGTISSLYSRELNRHDFRMDLGPIIGEVEPLP